MYWYHGSFFRFKRGFYILTLGPFVATIWILEPFKEAEATRSPSGDVGPQGRDRFKRPDKRKEDPTKRYYMYIVCSIRIWHIAHSNIYIYIHIYIYVCIDVCMYVYIHI